ncbi:hypothetical protein ACFQV2_31640 [Actinokineospora soli]|uniref:Uncharacterized protein n=1 Tax=Actinokineospora soli TaxID=1048753 RepID=A0ABW2TTZ5_9PSEU
MWGLPLALRVVAPLLADEPHLAPAELAAQLRAAPGVDGYAHGEQAVAAVLDLSWQRLLDQHPERARTLRLLCLAPGPDVSTDTAAALTDQPPPQHGSNSAGCATPTSYDPQAPTAGRCTTSSAPTPAPTLHPPYTPTTSTPPRPGS